jgi:hypothetical protein
LCKLPPDEVDIGLGELPAGAGDFESVHMVRFHKSFGTFFSTDRPSLGPGYKDDQRTVLVVQAAWLTKFLSQWDPNA